MQLNKYGVPRRCDITQFTSAELAIREAVLRVEEAGCHPWLTDAVTLLVAAHEKVADFVELPRPLSIQRNP